MEKKSSPQATSVEKSKRHAVDAILHAVKPNSAGLIAEGEISNIYITIQLYRYIYFGILSNAQYRMPHILSHSTALAQSLYLYKLSAVQFFGRIILSDFIAFTARTRLYVYVYIVYNMLRFTLEDIKSDL